MNPELKLAFARIKPICDSLLVNPSPEIINLVKCCVLDLKSEILQEMQLYVLFPVASHLKSKELKNRHEVLRQLVETMNIVLEKITVHLPDVFVKYHTCLLNLVFEKNSPGMVAKVSEELMLAVMQCMTTLMLRTNSETRLTLFKSHIPMLAQTIYIAAHIAKQEKLRALRLQAIVCLTAYIGMHTEFTNDQYEITDKKLEAAASEMATSILPGVVAALQHVATCVDNPGHAVVVAALNAIHKCICLVINDKTMSQKENITIEDFNNIMKEKTKIKSPKDVEKKSKMIPKRTPEWYTMVGDKLKTVTRSLTFLFAHDHVKVRMELAIFCVRILFECSRTMQPSITYVLDILIALTKDQYPELSQYCSLNLDHYFRTISLDSKSNILDCVAENFLNTLHALPKVLNNVDSAKKLASLNLVAGYLHILCVSTRPQRLITVLSLPRGVQRVCGALLEACRLSAAGSLLAQHAVRDVTAAVPSATPWCQLRHIDDAACEARLIEICRLLGDADCADLVVDRLIDLLDDSLDQRKECVYLCNWIGSAPQCNAALTRRLLDKYTEPQLWDSPLELGELRDHIDLQVYGPAAWHRDHVPGLYEGSVETRYTDISYSSPRLSPPRRSDACSTLSEAQDNMALVCSLTAGVGDLARRLGDDFQPYLLKTLTLVLERVGSKYEMLHLAGLKAINDITTACGYRDVPELIRENADYFTHQVTMRLKKAWNSHSALQILSVVMEYSDSSILNCLHGIVSDVLVQSCDKYHETTLTAYLQVFLTFVKCIEKWFPNEKPPQTEPEVVRNVMQETIDYYRHQAEAEALLNDTKTKGKTAEEMFKEDLAEKQNEGIDYDDSVTEEKKPLPQHVTVTVTILKRCLNFIPSKKRDEKLLSLQVIEHGLTILSAYEDELLPLIHLIWSPLTAQFDGPDPVVTRRCCEIIVLMTTLSKDFIKARIEKEILPYIFKYLGKSKKNSYLKDKGSAYRSSQEYKLQMTFLRAVTRFVPDLQLEGTRLDEAMDSVLPYLSNRQPKPLQELAVEFYKMSLEYSVGATWQQLRLACDNKHVLEPPDSVRVLALRPVLGIPFDPVDNCYGKNITQIFKQIQYADIVLRK